MCKSVYICLMAQKRYNVSLDQATMEKFQKKCNLAREKYSNVIEVLITEHLKNGD